LSPTPALDHCHVGVPTGRASEQRPDPLGSDAPLSPEGNNRTRRTSMSMKNRLSLSRRSLRRRVGVSAASLLALGGAFVAYAPTASAEGAPSCVSVKITHPSFGLATRATVTNHCRHRVRTKIIWRYALDDGCHQVAPGDSYHDTVGRQAVFDGVQAC